ncbi:hypothetical protein SM611_31515 [Actinomadura sp. DLS-62]|uniref:Uncharacterized protein n=1 Tax=Actinomadura monticuli TaxID=3097367 RepID=A0ABV4QJX3_9ACTN
MTSDSAAKAVSRAMSRWAAPSAIATDAPVVSAQNISHTAMSNPGEVL